MRNEMVACQGSRKPTTAAIEVVYPDGIYAVCPNCERHVATRGTTTRTIATHYIYKEAETFEIVFYRPTIDGDSVSREVWYTGTREDCEQKQSDMDVPTFIEKKEAK